MGFVAWIVVGAIAGFLANLIMGSQKGLLMMVVLGIVGGLVGGFVATSVLKMGSVNGINVESIVIATLGAIAVLFVVGLRDPSAWVSSTADRATRPFARATPPGNSGGTGRVRAVRTLGRSQPKAERSRPVSDHGVQATT